MLVAALLAIALQAAPPPADPGAVTQLEDVLVVGGYPTGLLTVVVEGEADVRTLVTSEPDLRCGLDAYRWEQFGRPRLCWLRRRLDTTVVLSATNPDRPGTWTVQWEGCDRVVGADQCEVVIQPTRRAIRATFHRAG